MNEYNQHIDNLIAKYLSENISEGEEIEFQSWLAASPENEEVFKKSKKIWEQSSVRISKKIFQHDKEKVLHETQKHLTIQLLKIKKRSFLWRIAAIIAVPLTFAISWYFLQLESKKQLPEQICQVTAPKGHVAKCFLPDGSEVWVNTGSVISYNTASFNTKSREIHLTGEAYFEVSKNQDKPFFVKTALANVRVTGTSFNVKAYEKSELFETVLAEGSIEMQLNNGAGQEVKLNPGERAVYDTSEKKIAVSEVDTEMYSSWRNGEILFKDATLNDLVTELERIYEIRFHLKDPKLGEYRFRGMFSYNNNLIEALEKIKRTAGIDYYIENKEVWLSKK